VPLRTKRDNPLYTDTTAVNLYKIPIQNDPSLLLETFTIEYLKRGLFVEVRAADSTSLGYGEVADILEDRITDKEDHIVIVEMTDGRVLHVHWLDVDPAL
jgi:hypothetical protein